MSEKARTYTELSRLKAIAHPLRAELYYRLTATEQSTATRLSEQVRATPSLVSYHLRELAKYGFVEAVESVDTDPSDGREKWWRVVEVGFTFPSPVESEGGDRVLLEQVEEVMFANQRRRLDEFHRSREQWGVEWSSAAFSADFLLRLNPEQTRELYEQMALLLRDFEKTATAPSKTDTDSETVTVILHGFPIR